MAAHSCSFEEPIKVGPWGGKKGKDWSFKLTKGGISEILISHKDFINSISFKADDGNGNVEYSEKFGGDDGKTDKVLLDFPGEYLVGINGTQDNHQETLITKSLVFYTNRAKYEPFGNEKGTPFYFSFESDAIVGFHGRAGKFLDAIGYYIKQSASLCSCQQLTPKVNDAMATPMIEDVPRGAGPWGGNKGKSWDDGVFAAVQQVIVHEGNGIVHAVQFNYQTRDGKSVWSNRHGGVGGDKIKRIKFDCESEYLVGVMGFYGLVVGNESCEALRSITFYTNKGKYGPFGDEIGTAFNSALSDGKIVGFHGRSGAFVDALGVHIEYL